MPTLAGVSYGRTSKDTDDSFSVSSQIDSILEFAKTHNIDIPDNYIFREDYTGKAFDRPEYSKIRKLIQSRAINCIVIYATDRLARKVSIGEQYLDEMWANGVDLYNVSWGQVVRNTPEDKLRFNFEMTFSSFEREKIIERTSRGRMKKADNGNLVVSFPLFGYSINEYKNGLVLNEYSVVVKEIMEKYSNRINPSKIADELNARRIPTPGMLRGKKFEGVAERKLKSGRIDQEQYEHFLNFANEIRGSEKWTVFIIHQLLRMADRYYGDYSFNVKGKEFHVEVPPIISKETADGVKKVRSIGKARFARKEEDDYDSFLMRRRLSCYHCGYAYAVRPKTNASYAGYYSCSPSRSRFNTDCINKYVRSERIDYLTIEFIRNLLLHPDLLFDWWSQQNKKNEDENLKIIGNIQTINARISDLQNKLFRTLDRLTDKLDAEEEHFYLQEKDRLKKLIGEYKEDKQNQENSLVITNVDQEYVQSFAEMGESYKEELSTNTEYKFWRGLVEDLDLTGKIGIDDEGQYIDFVLCGDVRNRSYVDGVTDCYPLRLTSIYYTFRIYIYRNEFLNNQAYISLTNLDFCGRI